jgi:hypothetical protein
MTIPTIRLKPLTRVPHLPPVEPAETKPEADGEHTARLRQAGLDDVGTVDPIQAIAILGRARWRMHPLGLSQ